MRSLYAPIHAKFMTFLGIALIAYGCGLLLNSDYRVIKLKSYLFTHSEISSLDEENSLFEISIPAAAIKQSVLPGRIVNGEWEVSEKHANYLTSSTYPGSSGNIVIYGHNHYTIFGNIRYLKPGDRIQLKDNRENTFIYSVNKLYEVEESDVTPILPTDHEILTIYTCSDLLGSKRVVVQALPIY